MNMPTGQDYVEALQNPAHCFTDPELKAGAVETDALSLPRPRSGNFASVFRLNAVDGRSYAIRCFVRFFPDQHERYRAISDHLSRLSYAWQVEFSFQPEGIRLGARKFPLVKMEWVEGEQLNRFVERSLGSPKELLDVAAKFASLVRELEAAGIAHGDLQHGNILITPSSQLKLVDYDGMFVPQLRGRSSHELGHRNYQHPQRTDHHFGPSIDRFSAWLIYASLVTLAVDPSLWHRLGAGDEFLLFKRSDFNGGSLNSAFSEIDLIGDSQLEDLATKLRDLARRDLQAVPPLEELRIELPQPLGSISFGLSEPSLPDWLMSVAPAEIGSDITDPAASVGWMVDQLELLPSVRFEETGSWPRRLAITIAVIVASLGALGGVGALSSAVAVGAAGVAALVVLAINRLLYHRLPVATKKRQLAAAADSASAKLKIADGAFREVMDADRALVQAHVRRVETARRDQQRLRDVEASALGAANEQHQAELRRVAAARSELHKAEQGELRQELDVARKRFIDNYLQTRSIRDARLKGVSGEVVADLGRLGFRVAADFSSVVDAYIQHGRYRGTKTAHLVRPDGQRVKVPGIGPVRGQRLQVWRRSIEGEAQRQAPNSVPPDVVQRIRAKRLAEDQRLSREEAAAGRRAQAAAEAARKNSSDAQRKIAADLRKARATLDENRAALKSQLDITRRAVTDAGWELATTERSLGAYGLITFPRHVVEATGIRSDNRALTPFVSGRRPLIGFTVATIAWLGITGYLAAGPQVAELLSRFTDAGSTTKEQGVDPKPVALPVSFAPLGLAEFPSGLAKLTSKSRATIETASSTGFPGRRIAIRTTVEMAGGQGDSGAIVGVMCRVSAKSFYALGVTGTNEARILKVHRGTAVVLKRKPLTDAHGPSDTSRSIGAVCNGKFLQLSVSGLEAASVADRTYRNGHLGVFVRGSRSGWVRGTFGPVEVFGPRKQGSAR
jgi:hypothetical protein